MTTLHVSQVPYGRNPADNFLAAVFRRPKPHAAARSPYISGWISCDYNSRDRNSPIAQRIDQVQSIHCGHIVINDQAPYHRQARFVEQVVAVGKGADLEALTLHHVSEGISHAVVINDEDGAWQCPAQAELSQDCFRCWERYVALLITKARRRI
jgi:hypothetical protein